jgi:hypothetical protein
MMFELVLNAQKYGQGDVFLVVDSENALVTVTVSNAGDFYMDCLSDECKSMGAKNIIERILRKNDGENYCLYDIILDVASLDGFVELESGATKIKFFSIDNYVTDSSDSGKRVKVTVGIRSK